MPSAVDQPGVGDDLAVHPQPGDAAVRVDRQAHVADPARRVDVEDVRGVPGQRGPRDQRRPGGGAQLVDRRCAVGVEPVDRRLAREVAGEVAGVDDDGAYDARRAEPHDRLVVVTLVVRSATAGLPPVVDLALGPERPRREGGRTGVHQVLPAGERLVVGPDDRATEGTDGEVGQSQRVGHRQASPRASRRPRGSSPSTSGARRRPANHVVRTTPRNRAPAYGETGLRWYSRSGSTTRSASGANATRSAAAPTRMRALAAEAGERRGAGRHPAHHVGKRDDRDGEPRSTPAGDRAAPTRCRPTRRRSRRCPAT